VLSSCVLSQNYPNPFNRVTVIEFIVTRDERVSLKILDTMGREAAVPLEKKKYSPGKYLVRLDCMGLYSGVYFYALETSTGFGEIRKFVLLK